MKNNFLNYFKENPLFSILLVTLIYFFSRFLLKNKSFFSSPIITEPLVLNPISSNVITDEQAQIYADELHKAMSGFGTNQDTITLKYNQLVGSSASLLKVYNAFGRRPYGYFGSPALFSPSELLDLKGWFQKELSEENIRFWNQLFAKIGL